MLGFFVALIGLALDGWGQQTPTLTVVAVDPAERTTLQAQDHVSIHVAYQSPQPVVIWMRPYFGGQEVKQGFSHPSPVYAAGTGNAFGWFQVNRPEAVDAIHVKMADARSHKVLAEFDHPVDLSFSGETGVSRFRADWAIKMGAAQQEQIGAPAKQRSNAPTTPGSAFFSFGLMVVIVSLFVATFAWPAYGIYSWEGWWRYVAAVPLLMMCFAVLRILIDTSRDPTSHNLWPFELATYGLGCLLTMAGLTFARRFTAR